MPAQAIGIVERLQRDVDRIAWRDERLHIGGERRFGRAFEGRYGEPAGAQLISAQHADAA